MFPLLEERAQGREGGMPGGPAQSTVAALGLLLGKILAKPNSHDEFFGGLQTAPGVQPLRPGCGSPQGGNERCRPGKAMQGALVPNHRVSGRVPDHQRFS